MIHGDQKDMGGTTHLHHIHPIIEIHTGKMDGNRDIEGPTINNPIMAKANPKVDTKDNIKDNIKEATRVKPRGYPPIPIMEPARTRASRPWGENTILITLLGQRRGR